MDRVRLPHQTGFSLVELMVALVLGVILTGGVISVYISSKSSYSVNNGLGQVEGGGRAALNFMQPLVVMGGYTGCSRPGNNNPVSSIINGVQSTDPVTPIYNFGSPVFGYEANSTGIGAAIPSNGGQTVAAGPTPPQNASLWTPALNWTDATTNGFYATIKATVLQYNDVFMVHEALSNPAPLISPYDDGGTGTYTLHIAPSSSASAPVTTTNFNVGELALVSPCDSSQFNSFQITAVNGASGTLSYASGGTPGNGAAGALKGWTANQGSGSGTYNASGSPTVQPVQTYAFYVGKGVDGWPALYEVSFQTSGANAGQLQTQELVSGVENMQVLYGVDVTGDNIPDRFETADQVQNADGANGASGGGWNSQTASVGRVVSIRIGLIMQSDDNSIDKAPSAATTYHMLGTSSADSVSLTPPVDRRVRRYFVQSFSLRNVLP